MPALRADLAYGNLIERFAHCMENFHLGAQIGRSENALARHQISNHGFRPFVLALEKRPR